jgi:hypothetical protein
MPKVVGLSVSFCIQDIVSGKVAYDDVEFIIGGTRAPDTKAWARVFDQYCGGLWRGIEVKAMNILQRLVKEGKIYQPRLFSRFAFPRTGARTFWVDFWDLDLILPGELD